MHVIHRSHAQPTHATRAARAAFGLLQREEGGLGQTHKGRKRVGFEGGDREVLGVSVCQCRGTRDARAHAGFSDGIEAKLNRQTCKDSLPSSNEEPKMSSAG